MLNLLRAVNRVRKTAGYSLLPLEVLPLRRRVVKPFGRALADSIEVVSEGGAGSESEATAPSDELGTSNPLEPGSE